MKQTPENQPFPNCPTNIDPTIPLIEYLGTIPLETQNGGQIKRAHRLRITLPDLPPFLIEELPEVHQQKLQEHLQYLQKQYPESFLAANQNGGKWFSDKYLQEQLAHIEDIRQMALSGSLFD